MSFSSASQTIPPGAVVNVNRLSGACIVSWQCDQEQEVLVISLAMAVYLAKMLNVPRLCLHFIWNSLWTVEQHSNPGVDITQERDLRGHQGQDPVWPGICVMTVQMIVSPLSPAVNVLSGLVGAEDDCASCGDPCDDADEPDAPRSREMNCMECEPCYLCHACRFQMGNKGWICFMCMDPGHESLLTSTTLNKLRLIEPRWEDDD